MVSLIKRKGYYYVIERIKKKGKWCSEIKLRLGKKPELYKPTIIKGFAETELKHIPDNSVDFIIIDPPYGINYDTNYRKDKSDNHGKISSEDFKTDIYGHDTLTMRGCSTLSKFTFRLYDDNGDLTSTFQN